MVKAKKTDVEKKPCCCKCFCSNCFKRIVTSCILIPLVLVFLYLGFPFINMFILVLGTMFAYEWAHMVKNKNPAFYALVYTISLAVGVLFPMPIIYLLTIITSSLLVFFKAKGEEFRKYLVLGVIYVGVAMSSILLFAQGTGFFVILWLLTVIWATDIGAYCVGSKLRGPKLAPKISPNKTWSGFFGGVLFAVVTSLIFAWSANALNMYLFYIAVAVVVSILGQIGDLFESFIKRKLNIKDSSQLIPGHGGIFDRMDSLLFVTPILLLANFINLLFM